MDNMTITELEIICNGLLEQHVVLRDAGSEFPDNAEWRAHCDRRLAACESAYAKVQKVLLRKQADALEAEIAARNPERS